MLDVTFSEKGRRHRGRGWRKVKCFKKYENYGVCSCLEWLEKISWFTSSFL